MPGMKPGFEPEMKLGLMPEMKPGLMPEKNFHSKYRMKPEKKLGSGLRMR